MTTILLACEDGLAIASSQNGTWQGSLALQGHDCQCVTFDPQHPGRVYCGTFDSGLFTSDDGGATWQPATGSLPTEHVMSLAVGPSAESGGYGLLWAGTEPSRLFVSLDGGASWTERTGLQDLPSKPTWSFPPRPWTHHVRWIEPDPTDAERLFVGIELGGVMRSTDGGITWEDRKPGSQHDCHTLRTHRDVAGLLYEAAGGGFAMSEDGGQTWQRPTTGMDHHYVYGLAVDSGEPRTLIASASHGAMQAHRNQSAESHLYRRSGDGDWQEVRNGLPSPAGTRVYILTGNPVQAGVFYAATGSDLYHSQDGGKSWAKVDVSWPNEWRSLGANGLAAYGA